MQTNIPRKISSGMWVMTDDGKVGILTDPSPMASVDLVDDAGETTVAITVALGSLRQAKLAEIPEARRPTPGDGAPLGYLTS